MPQHQRQRGSTAARTHSTMSVPDLTAKLALLQARVSALELDDDTAADVSNALYHDRFATRPPPKSHTTDLVACQRDSMLKTLTTTVTACEQKPKAAPAPKKKKKKKGAAAPAAPDLWLIQLEDTVLFPEGGGQPSDTGTITVTGAAPDARPAVVSYVCRTPEGLVLHEASAPLTIGASVTMTVDWERRFDHMQQHSSQVRHTSHRTYRAISTPLFASLCFRRSFSSRFKTLVPHNLFVSDELYTTYVFTITAPDLGAGAASGQPVA